MKHSATFFIFLLIFLAACKTTKQENSKEMNQWEKQNGSLFENRKKPINVLVLRKKKYYSEKNILKDDFIRVLQQPTSYNPTTKELEQTISYLPHIIDGWFEYKTHFTFIDTSAAKQKRKLDLATDTTIVKCKFDLSSTWNWEDENYTLKGYIEITEWKAEQITLIENFYVNDLRKKRTYKYKGKRTFTKN